MLLDDVLAVVREFLNPHVSRSGLDRCLRRHGMSQLQDLKPKAPRPEHKPFKVFEPGYLHVAVKYLPQMADEGSARSHLKPSPGRFAAFRGPVFTPRPRPGRLQRRHARGGPLARRRRASTTLIGGAIGPDLQGRQHVPATTPLPGSHGADRGPAPGTARERLAVGHAAQKALESGRHRAGQSLGAGGLGAHSDRGKLPGHPGLTTYAGHGRPRHGEARHAAGVPPARRKVMATERRNGNRNALFGPKHMRVRAVALQVRLRRKDRDPSAGGLRQGAQPSRCTSDAAHMAATDQTHLPNHALAPREPTTHGTSDNGERPAA